LLICINYNNDLDEFKCCGGLEEGKSGTFYLAVAELWLAKATAYMRRRQRFTIGMMYFINGERADDR